MLKSLEEKKRLEGKGSTRGHKNNLPSPKEIHHDLGKEKTLPRTEGEA